MEWFKQLVDDLMSLAQYFDTEDDFVDFSQGISKQLLAQRKLWRGEGYDLVIDWYREKLAQAREEMK